MVFDMDIYLRELYDWIIVDIEDKTDSYVDEENAYSRCSAGLHKLIQEIESQSDITLNFNEEGRLHSKYLGDRYEPAVILRYSNRSVYYYLFNGEIKDCIHPVSIKIYATAKYIKYYSSERIKQELPISILKYETAVIEIYNYNDHNQELLIAGYKSGRVKINIADYVKQDYFLHDCIEPVPFPFKFAD